MESQAIQSSQLYVRCQLRRYRVANADEIVEAARLVAGQRMKRGASFLNPTESGRFFVDKLAGLEREVFVAAFLDTRHRLIEYVELFQGTIDGAEVHPREVVRHALRCNAADRAVTARLKKALALVDVRLLDHIIVGGTKGMSMVEGGGF